MIPDDPYAPPRDVPGISASAYPRWFYIAAHLALLIAIVILLWPVLGYFYHSETIYSYTEGKRPFFLAFIHDAAVNYWPLMWLLTFVSDVVLVIVLRRKHGRPVRRRWFLYSTIFLAINVLVVFGLYFTVL